MKAKQNTPDGNDGDEESQGINNLDVHEQLRYAQEEIEALWEKESKSDEKMAVKWLRALKIDAYPTNIPIAEKYAVWLDYSARVKIQLEGCHAAGQRMLATSLYGAVGRELNEIINVRQLLRDVGEVETGFPFYDEMMQGLEEYFKSLSDASMNVNHLHNMKQAPDELASSFALRLQRQAKVCDLHSTEVIRNLFLKGMANKTVADDAYRQGWTMEVAMHAASREEAAGLKEPSSSIASISSGRALNQKYKRNPEKTVWGGAKKAKTEQAGSCTKCGFRNHTGGVCRAIDKVCYKCNQKGHFSRVCKQEVISKIGDDSKETEVNILC